MSKTRYTHPRHHLPFVVPFLARLILKVLGWKIVGAEKIVPKSVAISTHTSNWDGIVSISCALGLDIRARWMGKKELFKGPFAPILKLLGGVPVDRSKSNNLVEAAVAHINKEDMVMIAIAPEGSRSRSEYWKSGFYRIALNAGVPLTLCVIDYAKKEVGVGEILYPTGDVDADMAKIRAFYKTVTPRIPELQGEIRFHPEDRIYEIAAKDAKVS